MTDPQNEAPDQAPAPQDLVVEVCPGCLKPLSLCVCDGIAPIDNKIALLILMHPQEQDRMLGTARLAALHFKNAVVRIGLSWPGLSKALGRNADPARWAILYLGSAKADLEAGADAVVALSRKGDPLDNQKAALAPIEGIIVLDGSWSQAKALWWRNPWFLKCQRVILGPARPSRYGKLRREPRRDGLSTIEAVGMLMGRLERKPAIEQTLIDSFERMLTRFKDSPEATARSPSGGKLDRRRSARKPRSKSGQKPSGR